MAIPTARTQQATETEPSASGSRSLAVTRGREDQCVPCFARLKGGSHEELGAEAYLYGQLADENADEKLFTLRSDRRVPPLIGETIRLEVRTDAVHVFHPTTGDRLP